MKNLSPIPAVIAAVVQLVMLAVVAMGWRRLTRQSQHLLARIAVLELDVQESHARLDTLTATQVWRKAFDGVRERSRQARHLASVTSLPCPKGVRNVHTPGGES